MSRGVRMIRKVKALEEKEIKDTKMLAAVGLILWRLLKEKHGWTDETLGEEVGKRLANPAMYLEDFPVSSLKC